ncbi:flagellar biosynthesis anti-sigma factor FlgM [Bacillaceae bacterium SIJ1]|uniref:flagellar biosynthesis anti-sigma factor FlgM n=1 Tax=Litoribacterium kuwaitense TaxID=1398745 RepID=UPI0013ECC690|nr:flagellar biosynthesis anti-sigma factor FlgM [Litoribacterium kuwaitense]NGP44942.1 flagellar biosynthesis anti-sigma factor FlgM [Litoribacterium kuwaitense]
MKINPYQSLSSSLYIQNKENASQDSKAENAQQKELSQRIANDSIDISKEAKIMQMSQTLDEDRTAKLEKLKEQIDQGTYDKDLLKTAQKMFDYWNPRGTDQ